MPQLEGPIPRECVAEHTASGNWQGYFACASSPEHEMREIPICDGPYVDDEDASRGRGEQAVERRSGTNGAVQASKPPLSKSNLQGN